MRKVNIIKFLESYEEHPCLWDPRNNCYKNLQYRTAALNAMLEDLQLGISVDDLKLKIKSVRSMYTRECAKVASSKKSGAGTDDVYVPRVAWYEVADRFLRPVTEGRPTKTNLQVNSRESEASYFDDVPSGSQAKRLKMATQKQQEVEPILQAVNKLENISKNNAADGFDVFRSHMANQLRSLPFEEAISSQAYMNNYLAERRIKVLRMGALPTSQPESPTTETFEEDNYFDDSFFMEDTIEVETLQQPEEEIIYFPNDFAPQ